MRGLDWNRVKVPFEGDCPSYLCENGGTCHIDDNDDYACLCAPGTTGKRCELGTVFPIPKPAAQSLARTFVTVERWTSAPRTPASSAATARTSSTTSSAPAHRATWGSAATVNTAPFHSPMGRPHLSGLRRLSGCLRDVRLVAPPGPLRRLPGWPPPPVPWPSPGHACPLPCPLLQHTNFFDVNCASSCGHCEYRNETSMDTE